MFDLVKNTFNRIKCQMHIYNSNWLKFDKIEQAFHCVDKNKQIDQVKYVKFNLAASTNKQLTAIQHTTASSNLNLSVTSTHGSRQSLNQHTTHSPHHIHLNVLDNDHQSSSFTKQVSLSCAEEYTITRHRSF